MVEQGTVTSFNDQKGYGTIVRENGEELFFDYHAITGDDPTIVVGEHVTFDVVEELCGPEAKHIVKT